MQCMFDFKFGGKKEEILAIVGGLGGDGRGRLHGLWREGLVGTPAAPAKGRSDGPI